MKSERRSILELVARGRIDPARAERMLIAERETREVAGVLVAGMALALVSSINLQRSFAALLHITHDLLVGPVYRTALSLLAHL